MYFLFSTTLIASLNAQNFNPSLKKASHMKGNARSGNSSDQNITNESWMDGMSDGEIMFYQNFALSSKLYPNTLDVLLKAGLRSNHLMSKGLKLITESILSQYFQIITNWYRDLLAKTNPKSFLIWIYSGLTS